MLACHLLMSSHVEGAKIPPRVFKEDMADFLIHHYSQRGDRVAVAVSDPGLYITNIEQWQCYDYEFISLLI